MVSKDAEEGMLQPLARRVLQHWISLYADDVVMFLCPEAADIAVTMDILCLFDVEPGLKTNLQKSNVLPIRCEDHNLEVIRQQLPCALADFPCKYLGLPLALKKLKKSTYNPSLIRWLTNSQVGRWTYKQGREERYMCNLCSLPC
jgi:hypothetical protein